MTKDNLKTNLSTPHSSVELDLPSTLWALSWALGELADLSETVRPTRAIALRSLTKGSPTEAGTYRAEDVRDALREPVATLYALLLEADAVTAGRPRSVRKRGRGPVAG